MLSYPGISFENPTPKARRFIVVYFLVTVPALGDITPERILSNVLFPAPLLPIIPYTFPFSIEKDILFKALYFFNKLSVL